MQKNLPNIIEGILFVAGAGVSISEIAEKLDIDERDVMEAFEKLKAEKYNENSGIQIIHYKDKLQLCTNPEIADPISLVLNPIRERALTKTALETVAIIAYQQPITRLEIENIRGVSSDYAIQLLLTHNLIEVVGRKDVVGKPLLFGTTDEFLKRFDVLILGMDRQQGIGNLRGSLLSGAKAFLNVNNPIYESLENIGLTIFDCNSIKDLTFEEFINLEESDRTKNREIFVKRSDENYIKDLWSKVFDYE